MGKERTRGEVSPEQFEDSVGGGGREVPERE